MANLVRKFGEILYRLELLIAGSAFIVMVGVIVINVLARFLFDKSFAWAEEISYLGFNWAVFFGICIVYKNQGLISIDALVDRLPQKAQRIVQIFTFAVVGFMNIALVIWGMQLALQGFARTTAALQIPYFWMYIDVPIACLILMGYSFCNMITAIRGGSVRSASIEERA